MRPRASAVLPLILLLALVVRVGVVVATPHFTPFYDAGDYDRLATLIAHGHVYPGAPGHPTAFRPPLYPFSLAGLYALGGGWTAGRLLGALLGTVTVLLVFLIASRLWGRRVAVVAGVLTAIFPPLVELNLSLLSEPLFLALVLGALLALLQYRDDRRLRWAALAGVLCGLSALTRSNGIFLVLAGLLGVWTVRPRVRRQALVASAVVVACAALTVAPWVVRNTLEFHRYVGISTQAGYALAGTYNPESRNRGDPGRPVPPHQVTIFRDLYQRKDLDEAALGSQLETRALNYISDHPGYVAETAVWNTLRVFDVVYDVGFRFSYQGLVLQAAGVESFVSPAVPISLYVIAALALAGLVVQFRLPRKRRAPLVVWSVPVLMIIPAIFVWGLSRYRAPIDPFLTMLAALTLVAIWDRVRGPAGQAATAS